MDDEVGAQFVPWQLASGALLHVAYDAVTVCNRSLRNPVCGFGLISTRETGSTWSPRCFQALSDAHREAWVNEKNQ